MGGLRFGVAVCFSFLLAACGGGGGGGGSAVGLTSTTAITSSISPTCSANQKPQGNKCVCKVGYQPNSQNRDICEEIPVVANLPDCPTGEVRKNGVCECAEGREGSSCDCKAGYRPNGNICESFTCSAGEVKQGFACVCAEGREGSSCDCKAGYRPNGNICEPFTCSAGKVKQGFACVCAEGREGSSCDCKAGYRPNGNICEPFTCSAGKVKQGFACVCAEGREGSSCDCKAGYRPNGNICESFTCSAGEVKQGFACVCAEGREGSSCDCKAGYRPNGNICENFTCPAGEVKQGAACVCSAGKERKGGGSCGCKAGHRTAGNICVAFTCPAGKTAEGETCVCDSGTRPEGSGCVAFTCPAEKIPQGAVCVCKPGYRAAAAGGACIPENYDALPDIDTEHSWHYGLDLMNVRGAYHRGFFGQGVTIGIADSGVLTTHADFGDRIVGGYNAVAGSVTSEISDSSGHGTFVALVAAAGIGGDTRGLTFGLPRWDERSGVETTITITTASGYFHGVAPAAAVMPLQFGDHKTTLSGNPWKLFDHAVSSKIQIVNNSWGRSGSYYWGYEGHSGTVYKTSLPLFSFVASSSIEIKSRGADIRRRTGNADMVYVWASGNDGWHYSPGGSESPGSDRLRMCAYNSLADAKNDGACGSSRSKKALAVRSFSQQQLLDNTRYIPGGSSLLVSLIPSARTLSYRNDPGGYSNIPLYEPTLLKKWLVVGAVNSEDKLAYFSNGCGPSKMWCLVAPGRSLQLAPRCRLPRPQCRARSGTSFAAPHVSGALAVIKSAAPSMPMEAVRAVLLTSSRDLGEKGVDDVFGWGIPDVDKAVSMAVAATMAGTALENLNLRGTKLELPSQWAHLQNRLQNTEVAAGIGVGAYYNTKLSDWTTIESGRAGANLGRAAADMFLSSRRSRSGDENFFAATDKDSGRLVSAGAKWGQWNFRRRFCGDKTCAPSVWKELSFRDNDSNWEDGGDIAPPFFAADGGEHSLLQMGGEGLRPFAAAGGGDSPYRQFGMRWNSRGVLDYRAELSQVDESKSFWGANFGALGRAKTKTRLGVFSVGGDIAKRWRMRTSYRRAEGGTTSAEGLLSQVSELRAETWSAALERRDIFRGGDSMRFLALRRSSTRGRAELNVVRAEGDFTCGFYKRAMSAKEHAKLCGAAAPNLLSSRRVLDVGGGGGHTFAAAYATPLNASGKTRFALGAEYQSAPNTAAFSAELRVNF